MPKTANSPGSSSKKKRRHGVASSIKIRKSGGNFAAVPSANLFLPPLDDAVDLEIEGN